MKPFNLKSGYSIVEIIIYVAVFAVVAVVIMNAFIVLVSFFNQTRTNHDFIKSGNLAMERISREVRLANNIRTATSTLGTSPGVLDLDSVDASNNPNTIKFNVSSGALNLSENGTLVDNILAPNMQVTSLIFRQITTTNSTGVKIEMTIQDTRDKLGLTEKFSDTVILRGGY
jgi:type II secretory pathway pseudopilin PulG